MIREGLTFDDVLIVPRYSDIKSRDTDVDISVKWGGLEFKHPIIPANMKSVTGLEMSLAVCKSGGLAILHRFMPIEEQLSIARNVIDNFGYRNFAVSVGVKKQDVSNIFQFLEAGVRIFCIDIAHGDSVHCLNMIKEIRNIQESVTIIAGNVATGEGARRLWEAGADVVKIGVGPGSLCTTRIETGCGVPQFTALMDVSKIKQELLELQKTKASTVPRKQYSIIADGGIKEAGDIVKALCFADMVMIGNLFAGCEETPGKTHIIHNVPHKEYAGSSTHKTNHIEGVVAYVPCRGKYEDILTKLVEGLVSGCSYLGSHNLEELRDNPEFIRITNAGLRESHPHDVILR